MNKNYKNLTPFLIRSRNKTLTKISTGEDLLKILPKFHKINQSLIEFLNEIDLEPSVTISELKSYVQKYQKETSQFKPLFWTRRGYSEIEAKTKISEIQSLNAKKVKPKRKDQNPMCEEYYLKKGLSEQDSKLKLEEMKIKTSGFKIEFYTSRGVPEQEAKEIISKKQKLNADKYWSQDKSKERSIPNQTKYWVERGFSDQEAKQKVSEDQRNFSLDICIDKYGLDEGISVWEARQVKWQLTMNSKLPEEIERINISKGTDKFGNPMPGGYNETIFERNQELRDTKGVLYYVKLKINNIEFWKIGITKHNAIKRLMNMVSKKRIEIVFEKEMTLYEAFKEEQSILKKYNEFRITVNEMNFYSTECFSRDIFQEHNLTELNN